MTKKDSIFIVKKISNNDIYTRLEQLEKSIVTNHATVKESLEVYNKNIEKTLTSLEKKYDTRTVVLKYMVGAVGISSGFCITLLIAHLFKIGL